MCVASWGINTLACVWVRCLLLLLCSPAARAGTQDSLLHSDPPLPLATARTSTYPYPDHSHPTQFFSHLPPLTPSPALTSPHPTPNSSPHPPPSPLQKALVRHLKSGERRMRVLRIATTGEDSTRLVGMLIPEPAVAEVVEELTKDDDQATAGGKAKRDS